MIIHILRLLNFSVSRSRFVPDAFGFFFGGRPFPSILQDFLFAMRCKAFLVSPSGKKERSK